MEYVYVGSIPRNLASGRPLFPGDVIDAGVLTPADKPLAEFLVIKKAKPAPAPAPAPEPAPTTPEAS